MPNLPVVILGPVVYLEACVVSTTPLVYFIHLFIYLQTYLLVCNVMFFFMIIYIVLQFTVFFFKFRLVMMEGIIFSINTFFFYSLPGVD